MYFTSSAIPGVRAFTSALRARLLRAPRLPVRAPSLPSDSPASSALRARWRICSTSGQRQQRWSLDDSQDPPSRGAALFLQHA